MGVKKRSLVINGHATSLSLEDEFWQALTDIAAKRAQSVPSLVAELDDERQTQSQDGSNLSSAIRVFVLRHFQNRA